MRRAEERERLLRAKLRSTHALLLTWKQSRTALLVNFIDPSSRLAVTHQRVYYDRGTLLGLVQRSATPLDGGPREALFRRDLEMGQGEIDIEVTAQQYIALTDPRARGFTDRE